MAKDWKEQYLSAVEVQEEQRQRFTRKTSLMVRGLMSMGQLAMGVDEATDRGVTALRGLLRKEAPSNADLDLLVSALELRLKPAISQRQQASEKILSSIQTLLAQLQDASQDKVSSRQIAMLQRQCRNADFYYGDLPGMLNGVAGLQQLALKDFLQKWQDRSPQGKPTAAASSGWSRWFTGNSQTAPDSKSSIQAHSSPTGESAAGSPTLDWKLEPTVRKTLEKLLEQITPPASVMTHYKAARALISRDLNGYELAPALEHLCEVILASIQRDQNEFQTFLNQLNLRLQEAYNQLALGIALTAEESNATTLLSQTMLAHVSALQTTVAGARDIDMLKSEVTTNLDQIVLTIDEHSKEGAQRHRKLAQELESMSTRLEEMEESSRQAVQQLAKQKQLAMQDALTELPNRAAYNQRAAEELARWQRHHGDLCLAVCDVDWFKKVNDEHGHGAGDLVLQALATTLRARLRRSDFIARFGGEEFVILMPETNAQQAVDVLNQLREVVTKLAVPFEQISISITISIGITAFQGKDNLESAFTRADRALYDAKDAGRNCCRVIVDAAEGSVAAPSAK